MKTTNAFKKIFKCEKNGALPLPSREVEWADVDNILPPAPSSTPLPNPWPNGSALTPRQRIARFVSSKFAVLKTCLSCSKQPGYQDWAPVYCESPEPFTLEDTINASNIQWNPPTQSRSDYPGYQGWAPVYCESPEPFTLEDGINAPSNEPNIYPRRLGPWEEVMAPPPNVTEDLTAATSSMINAAYGVAPWEPEFEKTRLLQSQIKSAIEESVARIALEELELDLYTGRADPWPGTPHWKLDTAGDEPFSPARDEVYYPTFPYGPIQRPNLPPPTDSLLFSGSAYWPPSPVTIQSPRAQRPWAHQAAVRNWRSLEGRLAVRASAARPNATAADLVMAIGFPERVFFPPASSSRMTGSEIHNTGAWILDEFAKKMALARVVGVV